ncbi:MAG: LysR family transcriptional regulator [Clostridiales bacterium]|nr:LysR family transcriptional regulator [Clostridiales bacterium]
MSFRRIEYFLSVAKHLNFTKAARECFVAQAAISQQIKQFEEELGFKLFERGGAAVSLTPAGEYFARQCQGVLSQYNGAVKQARSIADGEKRDLRLGINGPFAQDSIPGFLRQFRQIYPESAITLREGGREEMLDALTKEELDVIIIPDYGLCLDEHYEALELSSERAKFMTGPHTPLAGRRYVSPAELAGQTIFRVEGLSEESQDQPLPDYFVRLGLGENPIQRVKTYLEATILVQAGLGIATIPGGMENKLTRDVSVFSIEGDSFRLRTIALRLLPPVSVAADHFFQVIRQELAANRRQ